MVYRFGFLSCKCPEGPGPRPLPALPSIFVALEKDLYFILNILGSKENLPRPRHQGVIISAKYVPGFENVSLLSTHSTTTTSPPPFSFPGTSSLYRLRYIVSHLVQTMQSTTTYVSVAMYQRTYALWLMA